MEARGKVPNLHVRVADGLRDEIERNELLPGQRLLEMHVARRFGVSQAPVREALRVLEREGLVEHRPRRGVYVRQLTVDAVEELYSLRAAIEGFAARRAVRLMTAEDRALVEQALEAMREAARRRSVTALADGALALHEQIVVAARHKRLHDVWLTIASENRRYSHLHGRFDDVAADVALHEALVRTLGMRDPDVAEAAMRAHIRDAGQDLLRHALDAGLVDTSGAGALREGGDWSLLLEPSPSRPPVHGRWARTTGAEAA
jgi:DNA-binding GntR family transcriptional regulator